MPQIARAYEKALCPPKNLTHSSHWHVLVFPNHTKAFLCHKVLVEGPGKTSSPVADSVRRQHLQVGSTSAPGRTKHIAN